VRNSDCFVVDKIFQDEDGLYRLNSGNPTDRWETVDGAATAAAVEVEGRGHGKILLDPTVRAAKKEEPREETAGAQ
jgi:hypothetical protein